MWEGSQAVIRGKTIQISSRIKRQQLNLENKIKLLEIQHKTSRTISIAIELKEAKKALDDLLSYKAEGALRFTRQRFTRWGKS